MRDPELVQIQKEIEILHDKNQLLPRLRETFREYDDALFVDILTDAGMDVDFGIELLVQIALHKRCDGKTMIGLMRRFFNTGQETADAIMDAVYLGLVDWDERDQRLVVVTDISPALQAELDIYQFVPPMVVQPMPVRDNRDVGLLTSRGSIILKKNHHDDEVRLEHINRMNSIPLSLNVNTAVMIQNRWKNLDRRKSDETQADYLKRVRAFVKFDNSSREIMAGLVELGNRFWLTHRYDKRGRTYCQGYHVTYQGADWNKAMIEFADKEFVR